MEAINEFIDEIDEIYDNVSSGTHVVVVIVLSVHCRRDVAVRAIHPSSH